jgi:hypothetical protein
MKTFAVLEGTNVVNTILCDSKVIAEAATGKTCVEYTTEPAEPGGTYISEVFTRRKPYPSWTLGSNGYWVSPVPYPEEPEILESGELARYIWVEQDQRWDIVRD